MPSAVIRILFTARPPPLILEQKAETLAELKRNIAGKRNRILRLTPLESLIKITHASRVTGAQIGMVGSSNNNKSFNHSSNDPETKGYQPLDRKVVANNINIGLFRLHYSLHLGVISPPHWSVVRQFPAFDHFLFISLSSDSPTLD